MKLEEKTLSNKVKALFIDAPGQTSASVQVWFRAGSSLETSKNQGIAHFLEHMFFKGTKKRPGQQMVKEVESFGGEINAFTSFDYTCYYINLPYKYIVNATDILLDMVANPQFKSTEITPEKEVVFEEFRKSLDNPNQKSFFNIQKSTFSSGYSHPILGKESSITNFSREQLIEFRENFYNLSNIYLIIAGDLKNRSKITETIKKYSIPNGPQTKFLNFKIKRKPIIQLHHSDVRMAQLTLVIPATPFTDRNAPIEDLALNCLGHGETSYLVKEMVLKNTLCNSISTSTLFFTKGGAHFVRLTAPVKHLKTIYTKFSLIIEKIVKQGVNEADLKKIKNQYIAAKIYEKESIESFSFSAGHSYALTGDINGDNEFIDKVRATSLKKVNQAISEIFSRPIHISLQLPHNEKLELHRKDVNKFHLSLLKIKFPPPVKGPSRPLQLSKFDPQVQIIEIKKGIKLIYRYNKLTPTFVLHTYIKGGICCENKKNSGIHNLICSLLTRGYNNISYDKIRRQLEESSSSLSGFSGKNSYGLTMHGLSEQFNKLSNIFFNSLLQADFKKKDLTHEIKLLKREFESEKEDPVRECFRQVYKLLFPLHPYSMSVLGTAESVSQISNTALNNLHQKNLKSREMVITYCGDMELSDIIAVVEEKIERLPLRNKVKPIKVNSANIFGKNLSYKFDREQTHIYIGRKAPPFGSKEEIYLQMLSTHLSGQSSELFIEVRDRQGLCYDVRPIHMRALAGSHWGIYIATGNDKVKHAIKLIESILEKIAEYGLNLKEFQQIKKTTDGQNLMNIQTNEDYANIYSVPVLHNLSIDQYYLSNQEIQKTSLKDFNKYIKKYLKKKFNRVIVGKAT